MNKLSFKHSINCLIMSYTIMMLQALVLGVLTLLCSDANAQTSERQVDEVCRRSVDVAIVGAGPAGAYAAYRLRNQKMNIEVFEFSNRIGGRLYTSYLPNAPDLPIDFGAMRYKPDVHSTVQGLVDAFGLTREVFSEKHGKSSQTRFHLRGQSLTPEQVESGDVPFKLSPEEKANQGRLFRYYLEKLTGYNGTEVNQDILMQLKVADGRYLHRIPVNEALDMVATPDGKEFLKAIDLFDYATAPDTSFLTLLESNLGPYSGNYVVYQIKEGMSAVPQGMIRAFLNASDSHALSLNNRLVSITRNNAGDYVLTFQQTQTIDGVTNDMVKRDLTVCAKKVIVAIPKFALSALEWEPLLDGRVNEAINAVRPVVGCKVFMSFTEPWWLSNASANPSYITNSDMNFSKFFHWGRSNTSGAYVILASYADENKAMYLSNVNAQGNVISGSPNGVNRVTEALKNDLLDQLSTVYGIARKSIPEPLSAASMFWKDYPFGGSWSLWKYGYRYDDVISTVQRPSLTDDVFLVGADHARGHHVGWSEGAYVTVDRVLNLYFF
ncbi:unnamed protein product [Lymnaea stagnalis]|uniref:Amine oxidase domain-containing protein n=1 Tax=Lymnaea stagnalis TaxID=6523 RepID=A0AAV2HFV2_LYMST